MITTFSPMPHRLPLEKPLILLKLNFYKSNVARSSKFNKNLRYYNTKRMHHLHD